MINNNKINNAFVQIIPEKIDITNYSNDKLRKSLTIQNNCNIPLIFHFTPSDSSFILLTDNTVRISPKSKKKIAFIISDNLSSPTSLNIFVRNDLKFYSDMWSYKKTITENSWTGKKKAAIIKTKIGEKVGEIEVLLVIPKEDIGKYNKFMIK